MHPPSIVEMKHGHICKHSKIFLKQQENMEETGSGEQPTRKGVFYHPKIECKANNQRLWSCTNIVPVPFYRSYVSIHACRSWHTPSQNEHTPVHGVWRSSSRSWTICLLDRWTQKMINLVWIKSDHSQPKIKDKMIRYVLIVNNLISAQKNQ